MVEAKKEGLVGSLRLDRDSGCDGGTQKELAEEIQNKKADSVMALKGNHEWLHDELKRYCEDQSRVRIQKAAENFALLRRG